MLSDFFIQADKVGLVCNQCASASAELRALRPTAQGSIDPMQKALVDILGRRMKLYGEALKFTQGNGAPMLNATGFPYGMSTCVRVAKIRK